MTEKTFWACYDALTVEQKDWVDAEIARIRVHDYDCENVNWAQLLEDAWHYYPA